MILDGHIHINEGPVNNECFETALNEAGIQGGILLSLPPVSFGLNRNRYSTKERLGNLFDWKGSNPLLYPFFWIDPLEEDALSQVELACGKEVKGFKIICNYFYPGDKRAVEVYKVIAECGKPVLFHSGILYDVNSSSKYNRPAEFETLMYIKGLRFALAHVSWPWCDENLAVYGKIQNNRRNTMGFDLEMFIDTTQGAPTIYRKEMLSKIYGIGYDICSNIFFGSDCSANDYDKSFARQVIDGDTAILKDIGLEDKEIEKVFSGNLKRFLKL